MRSKWFVFAAIVILIPGCGGGSESVVGRAVFTVVWPERLRLIPVASNSIKVKINRGGTEVAETVIPRPAGASTASVTFENLPVSELSVTATSHPGSDGSGIAQARGTAPLTIQPNQTTDFTVTMESTIRSVEIVPPAGPIRPGDVVQLGLTVRDVDGNLVLVSPASTEWTSANHAVATVDANGVVTAGTNGSALLSVMEFESQRGDFITVTVEGGRLIAYEWFNYPLGSNVAGQNGGTGWAGAWFQIGGTLSVIDSGLFFQRLQARNNSARTASAAPVTHVCTLGENLGAAGTTRYFSILLRPLDPMSPGTDFGFGFGGVHIGKAGSHASYLIVGGGGAAVSGIEAVPNATAFLIVRSTFTAGADRIELWVNPTPGQPLPVTPNAVKQDVDLGIFSDINLTANIRCHFDEIRIGETYGDVSPIVQIF